jgi:hypothetical protein
VLVLAWRGGVGLEGHRPTAADDVESADRAAWGTRSLSALVTVGGLWAAGLLLSYPMCANRLTLFAFFSLVLIGLEGFALLGLWLERGLRTRWVELAPAIIAVFFLPSAASTVETFFTRDAPQNVRPLLPIIATEPERAIVIARCSSWEVLTLPEWIGRENVFYADERLREGLPTLPEVEEFWLISTGGYSICTAWIRGVREKAVVFRQMSDRDMTARLFYVRMPHLAGAGEREAGGRGDRKRSPGSADGSEPP